MKIGVISDTHGYWDPQIPELFKGVDHILHAGDVGGAFILFQLEQIAPVTAIVGNSDTFLALKETEVVELGGHRILLHHIVEPRELVQPVSSWIAHEKPDVVVFGHTHERFCQMFGERLFFNPGYAGKPLPNTDRSVAILTWRQGHIRPRFLTL
jgi:putative phosphoesterase